MTGAIRHGYKHVVHAEFSPDGQRLLTASRDGTARLWELRPDDRPVEDLMLQTLARLKRLRSEAEEMLERRPTR